MEKRKRLPVGVDHFKKIRQQGFYYIDKTNLIKELITNWGEVNLFTRPRRFGKSLIMSMLQSFFEIGCDKTLFDGLNISRDKEFCEEYMGKFPVISISLKGVEGADYEGACEALRYIIGSEALRFSYLLESPNLTEEDKALYCSIIKLEDGRYNMAEGTLLTSLQILTKILEKHYGTKTMVLIDEYDVPLDKAFQNGYYEQMVLLIRNLFSNVLKSNDSLYFAVLTGCLRISKESIFTGLNNLKIFSITNVRFDEYFGFTDQEVKELLEYYGLSEHFSSIKEWYDGYQFGKVSVYCPWDVINHCDNLCADPDAPPEDYWSNTSSNSIVRRFINKADKKTKEEIEQLIDGKTILKDIRQDLTYNELDTTIDNLWSVLFTTGYLTQRGRMEGKKYQLTIPNREIRELFEYQIRQWFRDVTAREPHKLNAFCEAFPAGDAEKIESQLNEYLWNSISIRDTFVAKERKEHFYHGILLGLLQYKTNWLVCSNAESGEGYSDILIEVPESRTGIVIEIKYAENDQLDRGCAEALAQIEDKKYDTRLKADGMKNIIRYGIACYRKHCRVMR
ncbi:MAG: AAA family ATPase [Lachnospiraceae bacterium]|nr:AAA family ATPase [Lachnospiraceae bacterium]